MKGFLATAALGLALTACTPVHNFCERMDPAPPQAELPILQHPADDRSDRPNEVIVSEQYLDEGHLIDVHPPQILSYWPDFSKDDGTVTAANIRCEKSGGELIAEQIDDAWSYKCEHIDY